MVFILTYVVIYNLTSFLFFATFLQLLNVQLKTLFSFTTLNQMNFFTKVLSLTLLSLAGVPPLLGFFSKIFVFIVVSNSHFSVLFPPFFILLFIGLYFYIQNIRFLHSTVPSTTFYPFELSLRVSFTYMYFAMILVFFVIFGFCFVDDLLMLIS